MHAGALFLAYTMIIYLSNKIKSGLYRIYSTYMLEANSQPSVYILSQVALQKPNSFWHLAYEKPVLLVWLISWLNLEFNRINMGIGLFES